MAAPVRNLFGTATTGATNSDTLTCSMATLGASVLAGDVISVFVASDGIQTQSVSSGAGWNKIIQSNEAAQCNVALYRFDVTQNNQTIPDLVVDMGATNEMAVAHMFRIRASTAANKVVPLATPTTAQGSSTNPNPASITNNTGSAKDIYYLAVWGGDGNNVLSTVAPTNFANHQSTGIANTNGCAIGSADRTRTAVANAGVEDPGTFTRATEQWATITAAYYETVITISGTLNKTLGTLTSTSASALALKATVGSTLDALTSTSAAALPIAGQSSKTLDALTSTAASTIGGGATLWTLSDLTPDPVRWFDFQDAATVSVSGGFLQQWDTKGTEGIDAVSSGNPPHEAVSSNINGFPAGRVNNEARGILLTGLSSPTGLTNVQFAGASTALELQIDGVTVNTGAVMGSLLLSPHVLSIRWAAGTGNGTIEVAVNGVVKYSSNTQTYTTSGAEYIVADAQSAGSQNTAFPNNGRYFRWQSTTMTLFNQNDLQRSFDGDIGEKATTGALSDANHDRAVGSLAWKWGLQASLDAGHAYASAPPTVSTGISGTVGVTLGAVTSAAQAAVALQGTVGKTLGALTSAATSKVALAATVGKTLGVLTSASASKVLIQGQTVKTLAALTASSAADLIVKASLTKTLAPLTAVSASALVLKAQVGKTLGVLTSAAVADLFLKGTVGKTLAALTATASGQGPQPAGGNVNVTLGALTSVSEADLRVSGTVGKTLAALTSTSAGAALLRGTLSRTLDPLTAASVADLIIKGTTSRTLDALTSASAAALRLKATVGVTLAPLTLTAFSGTPPISGQSSITLSPLSMAATSALRIQGSGGGLLAPVTSLSSGVVPIQGSLLSPLGLLSGSVAGRILIAGVSVPTLAPLTLVAVGQEPSALVDYGDFLSSSEGVDFEQSAQQKDTTLPANDGDANAYIKTAGGSYERFP